MMIMGFVYRFVERSMIPEKSQHDDREGVGDEDLADEHNDGEHCGVPLFFERDDPIDIDECPQQGVNDDARAT
jgi:hypothetical protein